MTLAFLCEHLSTFSSCSVRSLQSNAVKTLKRVCSIPRSGSRPLLMVKEQTIGAKVVLPLTVCVPAFTPLKVDKLLWFRKAKFCLFINKPLTERVIRRLFRLAVQHPWIRARKDKRGFIRKQMSKSKGHRHRGWLRQPSCTGKNLMIMELGACLIYICHLILW